jgi:hypothetical protein
MSKPKAARDRLFRYGRPNIRELVLREGDGIGGDMRYIWGAYRKGSFPDIGEMDQSEFTDYFIDYLDQFYSAWIVEDKNYHYPDNYGPVGLIVADFNGWEMEPVFIPFEWITKKNVLKMVVAFFQMARYERGIGILSLSSGEESVNFFMKTAKRYNVIYYVGKIPRANRGDNRYMFYGRGKDFFSNKVAV